MKRILLISTFAILTNIATIKAQTVIIPDANFLNAMIALCDTSGDGLIQVGEAVIPTSMNVSGMNIYNLTGIQAFTSITSLNCGQNQLTNLNISSNTGLIDLNCNNNQLTSLNVSNNLLLTSLTCDGNQLTSLDVSNNIALSFLACGHNQINTLNLSSNTSLSSLSCYFNQLTNLIISNNTSLTGLVCSNNPLLSNLNISGCSALSYLSLTNDTLLSTLNISGCTSLPSLNCAGLINLTNFNASGCASLASLTCSGLVQLTSLNTSGCIVLNTLYLPWNAYLTTLDISGCSMLTSLDCNTNQLTTLNVTGCTGITSINCNVNQLTSIDVSTCIALITLNCSGNLLTGLNVSNNTALITLNCSGNQLTSLNVSNNTALESLSCGDNQLTNLNVSVNTALIYLDCRNNQLASLNVSTNTALAYLGCIGNQLTSLDVSNNTALTELSLFNNQLTSLDVSNNTALTKLTFPNNQLTSLDVSNNTLLTTLECSDNQLTSLDLSSNTALTYIRCRNNLLMSLNIQNGNNSNLTLFIAKDNLSLGCIKVDNVAFMNANFGNSINGGSFYNFFCGQCEITISNVVENNTSFANPKVLMNWIINATFLPFYGHIKVCADGSTATRIKFVNNSGINSNNIQFRMFSDPSELYPDSLGHFINYLVLGDTVYATYEHPKFLPSVAGMFRVDSFRIIDMFNPLNPIYSIPVNIYRAPVIMVHGIWGSDETFEEMENFLDNSGLYPPLLTERTSYAIWNNQSFDHNKSIVPSGINFILNRLRNNDFSAGKVDVITHSMGGLLTRYYLQGNAYQNKQDIHKFIALNAPQSGSQMANLLTNQFHPMAFIARELADAKNIDYSGYAINDLRINSQAMQFLNDPANLNKGHIPTHAINSTATVFNYTGAIIISSLPAFYYALAVAAATLTAQAFLDDLFVNQANDFAVSEPSQSGGLQSSSISLITPQKHTGSPNNTNVKLETMNALNTNSADPIYFNQNGFSPVPQTSIYKQSPSNNEPLSQIIPGSILINSPTAGQFFNPGVVIPVDITSNSGINRILFMALSHGDQVNLVDTNMSNVTINYNVPSDAFGTIKLIALGYDTSGLIGIDTLRININQIATLDSLKCSDDTIRVQVNNIADISLKAYFNNGYQYTVNSSNGVQYQLADTTYTRPYQTDMLWGKQVGNTSIAITYLGQTITIPVLVFPEDTTIHIDTTSIATSVNDVHFTTSKTRLLEIYPNPNNGVFNIKFETKIGEAITIEVYNQLGTKVLTKNEKAISNVYSKPITLKELVNGIYYVRVRTKQNTYSGKLTLVR